MDNCLFCKIVKGDIPSEKVYESDRVIAFKDIAPSANLHVLFIHKNHSTNISEMAIHSSDDIAEVFSAIGKWTKEHGLDEKGFRVVNNCGSSAGQTVFHTHFHILSDEKLGTFGR